jgi:DNA polymerase-3 subunit delta
VELRPDALARHLAGRELKPIYLLAGDEHLLLIEAADAIRARARELGYTEREVFDAGGDFDWNDLARAGSNLSLFASRRVVEIRLPTGRPDRKGSGAGSEALVAWAKDPPPDTVLLITAMTWSRAHHVKWVDAVAAAGVLCVFWPLKPEELGPWIAARAKAAGLALARDAVDLLVDRVEGNLLAAAQEIDKLVLLAGGNALDAEGLEQLVADHARFDVFRLVDAALAGDSARAVRIARGLRSEGEEVPALLPWLVSQLTTVVKLAQAVEAGQPVDAAMGAAGVWKNKTGFFRRVLGRAPRGFWEARCVEAAEVEKIAKGRAAGDPWRAFERLLARIAEPKVAARLAG